MGCGAAQGTGPSAHLRLGTPLLVHVHGRPLPLKFEDLDDLINSFAEPLVEHVNQLLAHKKFVDGSWESVQVRRRTLCLHAREQSGHQAVESSHLAALDRQHWVSCRTPGEAAALCQ